MHKNIEKSEIENDINMSSMTQISEMSNIVNKNNEFKVDVNSHDSFNQNSNINSKNDNSYNNNTNSKVNISKSFFY